MTCTLSWGTMMMICLQMTHTNHQGQEAKIRWNARGRDFEYECVSVMPHLGFSWWQMSAWIKHLPCRHCVARTGQPIAWLYNAVCQTWRPFIHVCIQWLEQKHHMKGCKVLRILLQWHYFPHIFFLIHLIFFSSYVIMILSWMPPHKWRVRQAI